MHNKYDIDSFPAFHDCSWTLNAISNAITYRGYDNSRVLNLNFTLQLSDNFTNICLNEANDFSDFSTADTGWCIQHRLLD